MATAAIVCEYNPFHNGHLRQIRLTREALGQDAAVVCVMSGDFVQRGAPAIFDRAVRAKAAIECGASLVLELPVTDCLRSAEGFGAGAVGIIDELGAVDALSFGCECGDADALWSLAAALRSERFSALLREELSRGLPFAAARERAVQTMTGRGALLRKPNNILAVEYCKALQNLSSAVRPLALARAGDYHGGDDPAEPSATAVRAAISRGEPIAELVPPEAAACFSGAAAHDLRFGERAMLARLRAMGDAEWEAVPFGSEGLWSKVMKNARSAQSVEEIISRSLSRRYARTRLQRLLLCAYLGIDEKTLFSSAPYVRALAFDDVGRAVLRRARERGRLNVINAGDAPPDAAYCELERRAADLYGLFSKAAPECGAAAGIRVYYKDRKTGN